MSPRAHSHPLREVTEVASLRRSGRRLTRQRELIWETLLQDQPVQVPLLHLRMGFAR